MKYIFYTNQNKRVWQKKLVTCYKEVFAAPPWNETWWTDKAVQEVLDSYSDRNSRILLTVSKGDVIGFCFGTYCTVSHLSKELKLNLPLPDNLIVGYIKDIATIESCRQRGTASKMLQLVVKEIKQYCPEQSMLLARTLKFPEPSVVYLWFPRLGFSTIAHYQKKSDNYGNVILGTSFNNIFF